MATRAENEGRRRASVAAARGGVRSAAGRSSAHHENTPAYAGKFQARFQGVSVNEGQQAREEK